MLNTNLQGYYKSFLDLYQTQLNGVWNRHINIENAIGHSKEYTISANYKYFFIIFYSIKSKMYLDSTYDWSNVEQDYDLVDIVKKLYCNNLKFKDFLDIFNIDTTIGGDNILVTIDRIYMSLLDNGTFTQLYRE